MGAPIGNIPQGMPATSPLPVAEEELHQIPEEIPVEANLDTGYVAQETLESTDVNQDTGRQ